MVQGQCRLRGSDEAQPLDNGHRISLPSQIYLGAQQKKCGKYTYEVLALHMGAFAFPSNPICPSHVGRHVADYDQKTCCHVRAGLYGHVEDVRVWYVCKLDGACVVAKTTYLRGDASHNRSVSDHTCLRMLACVDVSDILKNEQRT
jgi:hypothetical protein